MVQDLVRKQVLVSDILINDWYELVGYMIFSQYNLVNQPSVYFDFLFYPDSEYA